MTLLDRYVGRIVAGAFAACLLFFLFLSILIEALNSLAKHVDRADIGGWTLAVELVGYYASLLPVVFTTVTPFVTVIACMFAVARLQNANEIVAMLFTGRSIHRVLAPMLLCGVVAGAAMVACWQWVVPQVAQTIATTESRTRHGRAMQENVVYEARGETDLRLVAREYDPMQHTMYGVQMLVEGTLASETTLTTAVAATWDPGQRDWRLEGGRLETRSGYVPQDWLQRSDLAPEVLLRQGSEIDPDLLSYTALLDLVERRPTRADVRMALHRHVTYPLANVLLLLLALPFAVRYERGSRVGRLLIAIGLCAAYTVFDITCQSLGQHGLHPVVAAWSPTIVFGALGVVLFGSTRS